MSIFTFKQSQPAGDVPVGNVTVQGQNVRTRMHLHWFLHIMPLIYGLHLQKCFSFWDLGTLSDFATQAVYVRFSLGESEFRLAMTDRATITGMEVAKLVPRNTYC